MFKLRPVTRNHRNCRGNYCPQKNLPIVFWGSEDSSERFGYVYCRDCLQEAMENRGTWTEMFRQEANRILCPKITIDEIRMLLHG